MTTPPDTGRPNSWTGALAVILLCVVALGCGGALERSARTELAEDGYHEITLTPLERADNAFSFEARRDDQPCQGEIEINQQMGQTVATVTSRCGE